MPECVERMEANPVNYTPTHLYLWWLLAGLGIDQRSQLIVTPETTPNLTSTVHKCELSRRER